MLLDLSKSGKHEHIKIGDFGLACEACGNKLNQQCGTAGKPRTKFVEMVSILF
jgi:hypothetical protein